jgi:macrolide transport system ATP-binding/permease protein
MRQIRALLMRLAGLFGKAPRDREFESELQSQLQMQIDDNLRAGMTPEQARREALVRFGGVESVKEDYRDRRGIPVLETTLQDARYALRSWRRSRSPLFSSSPARCSSEASWCSSTRRSDSSRTRCS